MYDSGNLAFEFQEVTAVIQVAALIMVNDS
jgi:hypothetical protein